MKEQSKTGAEWLDDARGWYEEYRNNRPVSGVDGEPSTGGDTGSACEQLRDEEERKGKRRRRNVLSWFKKAVECYADEDNADKNEPDKHYKGWGNAVYELAVVERDFFMYNDARKHFEAAVDKYGKISGKKDASVLRRLGNAKFELASIAMASCRFSGARELFEDAIRRYAEIDDDALTDADCKNWGNALFAMGQIKWLEWETMKRLDDPTCKESIKKDLEAHARRNGNGTPYDAAKIAGPRPSGGAEGVRKKLKLLFDDVKYLFEEAKKKYEKVNKNNWNADILCSFGEMYGLEGRIHRYEYLYKMYEIGKLAMLTNTAGEVKEMSEDDARRLGDDAEELTTGSIDGRIEERNKEIDSAIKWFTTSTAEFEKAVDIEKKKGGGQKAEGREDDKNKGNWIIAGANYYRLYLSYKAKGDDGSGEGAKARKRAKELFEMSGAKILEILIELDDDISLHIVHDTALYFLLDEGAKTPDAKFFKAVVTDKLGTDATADEINKYKKAYLRMMHIVSRLEVSDEGDGAVAHYAKKSVTQGMVFDERKFWLNAAQYFNDPEEGKILLYYMYKGKMKEEEIERELAKDKNGYVACAGSFSFSPDSLNQFRLYGKEDGLEGTGLSIVFNQTFFRDRLDLAQGRAASLKDIDEDRSNKKRESGKDALGETRGSDSESHERYTLFRCVYLDTQTERVETVGQKEKYLFYREAAAGGDLTDEKRKKAREEYERYDKLIQDIVNDVDDGLRELRKDIDTLKPEIVRPMLMRLRYLVKPISFKEEQECRIVKICAVDNREDKRVAVTSGPCTAGAVMMHYEYDLDVGQHVKEVRFGPKASDFDIFKLCLEFKGLDKDVMCERSMHKLA